MPLKWYGTGDQTDPLYLHFSRIVNLTIHFMLFSAVNSGLWLFQQVRHDWSHLQLFSGLWFGLVVFHLAYVIALRPKATSKPESETATE